MAEEMPHEIHGNIINMQEFSQACCANEALTFDLLAGIFDQDRRRTIMERCFEDDSICRLFAGDTSVPKGWSSASMTKFLDESDSAVEEKKERNPFRQKKKRKVGRPLYHVFKEADEAA